jgi:hypothetical protein
MSNFSKNLVIALWLLAVCMCIQSCNEQGIQIEKQQVQFTVSPMSASASGGRVGDIVLPENSRARISVAGSNGVSVLSDHEIAVFKTGGVYVTEPVELVVGAYTITDFIIVNDSSALYVTPKRGAELSSALTDALPYNFSIAENNTKNVSMSVMDVGSQDLNKFGYAAAKTKGNTLSIAVYETNSSLTRATAELRQNNKLVSTFSLAAGVNTINLGGDVNKPYSITVHTANSAKTQTFDMKKLKHEIGKNPFKIVLEPALVLTIQSYVDAGNEYEEYFDFRMDGKGKVTINWGDGEQSATTLPFETSHEYFTGDYTAIITGDIDKATDFSGFSYSSIISTITGLRNLPALKVYDPSWGAVPIKVDLSNCKRLERINIAKYGAPYEPVDLRTDFKLPKQHRINTFIFDAPSFDSGREYISAAELDVMVNNIYNNVIARHIYDGKFFVNPVVTPLPATQRKIDVLRSQYNWQVGFNDDIYNAYEMSAGRSKDTSDPNAQREKWLRERFSNSEKIIKRARELSSVNDLADSSSGTLVTGG